MIYGVQLAALAIVVTIIISFFQYKRISLMSTKLFTAFLVLALFNILTEFLTLYTIWNIETVSPAVNRFCHQLFIGSLDIMTLFMFLYVDMKARGQERYRPLQLFVRIIPALAAFVMVLFGRLEYYIGEEGRYSYGMMAMTVYVSIAIYMALIFMRLLKSGNCFTRKEKKNLFYGIVVWLGIAVFQYFHPVILLSSLGVGLMVAFVYISFENPREYQEREIPEVMNRYALGLALSELLQKGDKFYIVSMVLTNEELLRNVCGWGGFSILLQEESKRILGKQGGARFCFNEYTIITLFTKEKEYQCWRQQWTAEEGNQDAEAGMPLFREVVLECPKYAADQKNLYNLLEFVGEELKNSNTEGILEIDEAVVNKVNYYGAVEQLVQKAIMEDGLEVFFQPIYSTEKHKFISSEALVRLKDRETLGFVSPEVFIPMAEKKGMIQKLGNMVFEQVCRFVAESDLKQYGVEYIEVNLSGIQCMDEKLPETLLEIAEKYKVSPEFFNLEITETAAVKAGAGLFANMKKLRKAGCHFSMDDFGTGYSNLSQIAEINYELIKLDKSLLWPCFEARGEKAGVILKACIDMIHHLGSEIVAEGVETKEQAELLMERNVEYLQGYYYAKPMEETAYVEFLKRENQSVAGVPN